MFVTHYSQLTFHHSLPKTFVMKKLLCASCLLLAIFSSQAQNITAAEYFFDSDPGMGNGISLSVGPAGETINFTASISTASLSSGFHTLAIRTRDANNLWGAFESRAVYVSGTVSNAANINAAEYFIDADPGAGNGSTLR